MLELECEHPIMGATEAAARVEPASTSWNKAMKSAILLILSASWFEDFAQRSARTLPALRSRLRVASGEPEAVMPSTASRTTWFACSIRRVVGEGGMRSLGPCAVPCACSPCRGSSGSTTVVGESGRSWRVRSEAFVAPGACGTSRFTSCVIEFG